MNQHSAPPIVATPKETSNGYELVKRCPHCQQLIGILDDGTLANHLNPYIQHLELLINDKNKLVCVGSGLQVLP